MKYLVLIKCRIWLVKILQYNRSLFKIKMNSISQQQKEFRRITQRIEYVLLHNYYNAIIVT